MMPYINIDQMLNGHTSGWKPIKRRLAMMVYLDKLYKALHDVH